MQLQHNINGRLNEVDIGERFSSHLLCICLPENSLQEKAALTLIQVSGKQLLVTPIVNKSEHICTSQK